MIGGVVGLEGVEWWGEVGWGGLARSADKLYSYRMML